MQTLRNIAGKKSIITKSYAGNEGKIVTCIRLATEEEAGKYSKLLYNEGFWLIEGYINSSDPDFDENVLGKGRGIVLDRNMTPLQDLDEPEQQVQELYAPSPKKETLTIKIDTTQLQKQLKEMLDNLE